MEIDISIITLAIIFFVLALLMVLLLSLRMPHEHSHKQNRRNELRQMLLKNRLQPSLDDRNETEPGNPTERPSDQVH